MSPLILRPLSREQRLKALLKPARATTKQVSSRN
ncbi:MAG: hypothetical protein B7Z12_12450 [Caulobacter vibrioides]|uniref:Uncharacterized protein n=1 Tax=Caulobacter vibrioides TaxID=155892 RepID=A0A258D365_CAUVI|nr:MAG: hypothetical protein B7Z12_12450 [Caulobacter vibrioides]